MLACAPVAPPPVLAATVDTADRFSQSDSKEKPLYANHHHHHHRQKVPRNLTFVSVFSRTVPQSLATFASYSSILVSFSPHPFPLLLTLRSLLLKHAQQSPPHSPPPSS
uniref:Uncharacterized protein n=1 Tax=Erythrolobus madagascarensis TaxID=708628 RepID=A0A7S0T6B2_9RHOD